MDYKISIIIATYNADSTLARCLEHIRAQKTKEIELLIMDGESSDNTLTIVDQFNDIVDVCVSEPDKGIYDAWNKAVVRAKGDWMMFLGADDYLEDDALSFYLNLLSERDCSSYDLICGKAKLFNEKGKVVRYIGIPYRWESFRKQMLLSHGSSLHNKNLFKEVGLFDIKYNICGDYEFLLRKKLNSLFVDRVIICMQYGGVSSSFKSVWQTFQVRKHRHSTSLFFNLFYFCKGIGAVVRNKIKY